MLVKDGEEVKAGAVTSEITDSHSGSSSMAVVLQCTPSSFIWLRSAELDEDACNIVEKDFSSFTGFKIFRSDDENAAGFTAQLSANTTSAGVIVFDEEVINIDGSYNPETGQFTCPRDGLYVFSLSAHITSGWAYPQLLQNDAHLFNGPYVRNSESNSEDSGTSTLTRLTECQEGDTISVYYGVSNTYLGQLTSLTGYGLFYSDEEEPVAFHAHLSSYIEVADGGIIVFDEAPTNEGGFYNTEFGVFLCPDNQLYAFIWSLTATSEADSRELEAVLVMNGDVIKVGPRSSKMIANPTTSSTQVVVRCQQSQGIMLEAVSNISSPIGIDYAHSSFVGFRLPNQTED